MERELDVLPNCYISGGVDGGVWWEQIGDTAKWNESTAVDGTNELTAARTENTETQHLARVLEEIHVLDTRMDG